MLLKEFPTSEEKNENNITPCLSKWAKWSKFTQTSDYITLLDCTKSSEL